MYQKHYGKKGIIFALDALLAVLLVIFFLVVASYFLFWTGSDVSSNLQLVRTGSDIITVLDNTKTLDALDDGSIKDSINDLMPKKYGFRVNISWQNSTETEKEEANSFEIGNSIPNDRFVATGKRFFLVTNEEETDIENFAVAKYWIWVK